MPGIELGLLVSETRVITITLHNLGCCVDLSERPHKPGGPLPYWEVRKNSPKRFGTRIISSTSTSAGRIVRAVLGNSYSMGSLDLGSFLLFLFLFSNQLHSCLWSVFLVADNLKGIRPL